MKIERVNKIANSMKDSEEKVSVNALMERLNSVSFWELLTDTVKIEIPIIQRDYAQGREDKKTTKIRASFVDSIVNAIESEENSLELDFVYGDINNGIFQPLDGQQRLTTLFLLHWYLANITGNLTETKNYFNKFTYETRISSRDFCNELAENGEYLGKGETIREQIVDSSWFFLSWKNDPTIKAMLVMLDSIEERLKDKNKEELRDYWQKLTSENPPITFHFKQLNDIGLTDDLYIKMNARGKLLTDFENFKARFQKYIEKNKWEQESMSPTDRFSHKIDTVWTDLFWKHRGDDNQVDNEFVKFIAGVAINYYAQNQEIFQSEVEDLKAKRQLAERKEKSITAEAIKRERIERRITFLFKSPNEISPEDFPSKSSFEYLKKYFAIYSENKYDELKPAYLTLWEYLRSQKVKINNELEVENSLFIVFVKSDDITTYKQRILFYAQTHYLLNTSAFDEDSFSDWIRVVRNIVQNATINSAEAFIGAIGLINELSSGCTNIYDFLNKDSVKSEFASKQVKEEVTKAKIIKKFPDAKSVIHRTEDTNFCKGKIRFPLYCIDFNIENGNSSNFDINRMEKILSVIDDNFTDLNGKLSDDFKRAFLTIKGNDYFDVWPQWSYKFNCHKRWLLETVNDLKNFFSERSGWEREYLKDLFLELEDKSFNEIISEYTWPQNMPNWEKRLIKEPDLLNGATFILISDFNNPDAYCKIAWQQRPSREDQVKKIQ